MESFVLYIPGVLYCTYLESVVLYIPGKYCTVHTWRVLYCTYLESVVLYIPGECCTVHDLGRVVLYITWRVLYFTKHIEWCIVQYLHTFVL